VINKIAKSMKNKIDDRTKKYGFGMLKESARKSCLILVAVLTINGILAQEGNAVIGFERKKHDFGKIDTRKDSTVNAVFHFENKGDAPLVVYKVTTSCGCTASEWTETPVEAGKKGQIKIVFNPKGFSGKFSKSIFVKSNAGEDVVLLKIEGEIVTEESKRIFNLFRSDRKSQ
jgi:hypothetical protein